MNRLFIAARQVFEGHTREAHEVYNVSGEPAHGTRVEPCDCAPSLPWGALREAVEEVEQGAARAIVDRLNARPR